MRNAVVAKNQFHMSHDVYAGKIHFRELFRHSRVSFFVRIDLTSAASLSASETAFLSYIFATSFVSPAGSLKGRESPPPPPPPPPPLEEEEEDFFFCFLSGLLLSTCFCCPLCLLSPP